MRERWTFANLHTSALAWLILGLSAIITITAWKLSHDSVMRVAQERFDFKAHDIQTAIRKRMEEQEVALWGGVGLFNASENVTRQEWRAYAESLRLPKYLPGLQGFGYAEFVSPDDKDALVARVRNEGFPTFDIKPGGRRDLYSSILFLEPFADRNLRAFGFDMWSEPTRREAMARARDTGQPALSGMVTLVQENGDDFQRGFLMYLPVYWRGMPTETLSERRAAIKGFVYSPFRAKDLMQGILGKGDTEIDFRIFDGHEQSAELLLHDSAGNYAAKSPLDEAQFMAETSFTIGGQPWTLAFRSRPNFISPSDASQPMIIAMGGILIDILLFLTISALSTQRRRAMAMANDMTGELRRAKESAERAAEAELTLRTAAQESNAKLQTANKGLMKFTSIIAHDLRAPLKRIEAFVEILREDFAEKLDDEGKDVVTRIERGASRMRMMLDSMHDYTKHSNISIEGKSARLACVVDAAIETLDEDLREAEIAVDISSDCNVRGDGILLEHVLQNLLSNSIKFKSESDPVISIAAQDVGSGTVELVVTDNGIGIEPEHVEVVFDMFSRLHNEDEYEGTGIGLAVCKKIIQDHGGDIHIDPSFTGGTRMVVTLRAAVEKFVENQEKIAA